MAACWLKVKREDWGSDRADERGVRVRHDSERRGDFGLTGDRLEVLEPTGHVMC